MNEIWKDIPNYEGYYQVSNLGRVKSLDRIITYSNGKEVYTKGKIIKQSKDSHNRLRLILNKNGKKKNYFVHSLVALSFIGEKPDNYIVAHCNGDNNDNRLSNLRYDTIKENSIDMYRHGGKVSIGKFSINDVMKIGYFYDSGNYTMSEIGEMYNVRHSTISKIIRKESFYWLDEDGFIKESKTGIK